MLFIIRRPKKRVHFMTIQEDHKHLDKDLDLYFELEFDFAAPRILPRKI